MFIPLNRIRRLAFFAVFCVAWFNVAVGGPLEAISALKKTVLVLYGNPLSIPAIRTTEQGLMAGLSRGQTEEVEIFSEYLDLSRFPAAQYGDDLVHYLRARYAARKPDVVIAVGSSALELALAHRDELFAGTPIVFTNVDHHEVERKEMPPNVTGLWMAGIFSEQWSWRSNCNPKLAKSFASAALESRSKPGTMKRGRSWSALPPGFAPAGWTNGHWKPCWMKSLNCHLIRWCFTYQCFSTGPESRSRHFRWRGSSLKFPACRSTVCPGPNLNKESSAELCWIFRRSGTRPPHSPSAYSRVRDAHAEEVESIIKVANSPEGKDLLLGIEPEERADAILERLFEEPSLARDHLVHLVH
jgi:hypothetical protein